MTTRDKFILGLVLLGLIGLAWMFRYEVRPVPMGDHPLTLLKHDRWTGRSYVVGWGSAVVKVVPVPTLEESQEANRKYLKESREAARKNAAFEKWKAQEVKSLVAKCKKEWSLKREQELHDLSERQRRIRAYGDRALQSIRDELGVCEEEAEAAVMERARRDGRYPFD